MLDFKPSMMHFLFTLRLRKAMPIINLKEHYPTAHPKDFFVEVSDEVHPERSSCLAADRQHQAGKPAYGLA